MNNTQKDPRFWELDVWRGLAVTLMIIFHSWFMWALVSERDVNDLPLISIIIARLASTSFLILVGVSGYISYHQRLRKGQRWQQIERHFFRRGLMLFGYGILISYFTFKIFPHYFILFGILHMIGVTLFLMPAILRYKLVRFGLLITSALVVILEWQVGAESIPKIFTGLLPRHFSTLDYWPLFPWISLVIFGFYLAERWYKTGTRNFQLREKNFSAKYVATVVNNLEWMGKHALVIYMIHAPIILSLLWLIY